MSYFGRRICFLGISKRFPIESTHYFFILLFFTTLSNSPVTDKYEGHTPPESESATIIRKCEATNTTCIHMYCIYGCAQPRLAMREIKVNIKPVLFNTESYSSRSGGFDWCTVICCTVRVQGSTLSTSKSSELWVERIMGRANYGSSELWVERIMGRANYGSSELWVDRIMGRAN